MRLTLMTAILSSALAGCLASGTGTADVQYGGGVEVSTPDLVEVSPGVQVVADYDEPVFYTDGFYWRFYNNGWYRSNYYASGWSYYDRPPVAVLSIDRPYAYSHYRPSGYVPRHQGRYQPPEVINRDHRGVGYGSAPGYRQPPPAVGPGYRQPPPAAAPGYRQPPPAAAPGYRQPAPAAAPGYRQPPPAAAPAPRPAAPPPAAHRPAPAPVVREHR